MLARSLKSRAAVVPRGMALRTYKDLAFGNEARQNLLKGITLLTKAVQSTMGPGGRTVLLDQPFGPPKVRRPFFSPLSPLGASDGR